MPRWTPPESKTILQAIADDVRRVPHERAAARRELAGPVAQSPPSPRRRGRNANTPQSQEDIDSDLESSFRYDSQLTTQDRIEIERGFEPSTQAILAAFGSSLLWLFQNNAEELRILIDLHGKTQSDFVRAKTIKTIRWIADYSDVPAAKLQAQVRLLDASRHRVAGMAEICGSGSLTLAAVRLQSQNSQNTVTIPNASHARKNNRKTCISITRARLKGMFLEEEYRECISSLLRDCKYPVNSGLSRATSTTPEKKGRTWGRPA
jgi:hypothetical protein